MMEVYYFIQQNTRWHNSVDQFCITVLVFGTSLTHVLEGVSIKFSE